MADSSVSNSVRPLCGGVGHHAKQESVQWLLPGAVRLSCVLRFKSFGPVSKLLFGETKMTHLQDNLDRAAEAADNGNVDEVYRLLKP